MHRLLRCAGLLILTFALIIPTFTPAQDRKADDPKKENPSDAKKTGDPAPPKMKERPKPDWNFEFNGKITVLDEREEKSLAFTIQVTYQYPEFNADVQRQIAQHQQTLAQQQVQFARAKSLQERQNIVNQMANTARQIEQSQAQLWKVKDVNFDVKCQAADNMRVRKYEPIQQVDTDTGEFLKWTKERLAEAKGFEGYPGYKADAKILRTGQGVRVYLSKDSPTPASVLAKGKADNKKVEELQEEFKNFRYDVIMIYVVYDAPKK